MTIGLLAAAAAFAQAPAAPKPDRPTPPTRDPHTVGYVAAKELPDGEVPPANADGNFVIGPTHPAAAELSTPHRALQGRVLEFTMNSADSRIYPGIAREPNTFGTPDPSDPAKLIVTTSHPAPYTRQVAVYVPRNTCPAVSRRSSSEPTALTGAVFGARQPDRRAKGASDGCHLHRQRRRRRPRKRTRPRVRHHVRRLCRVRREGSVALVEEQGTREADKRSRRPRDDGRQLRRLVRPDHGVVSPRALSPRAGVLGDVS